VNHAGRSNGYGVPDPGAQGALIAEALAKAGVDPRTIGYVEAQGIGSALGDPIEIAGLRKAFGDGGGRAPCAIGSIKSNIGHAEAAAGIAGVTKAILQLRHRTLVPSLHAEELNPHIEFGDAPFRVQRELAEWSAPEGTPRRACVSAFGAGGANAHVVLEEHAAGGGAALQLSAERHLVVLSARTKDALARAATRLHAHLGAAGDALAIGSVALTLQVGREGMRWRLAVIASSMAELLPALERAGRDPLGATDGRTVFARDAEAASDLRALLEKPIGASLVELATQRADLEALADLWTAGATIGWRALHAPGQSRIPLPTYPFARTRYWVGRSAPAAGAVALGAEQATLPATEPRTDHRAIESVETFIRETLAGELKLDPGLLEAGRDVAEYGASSVERVRLLNRLRSRYGDAIPAAALAERTIGGLAETVRHALAQARPTAAERRGGSTGSILLTGATGVVGAHLVKHLLATTQRDLVCVARGRDAADARERCRRMLRAYDEEGALEGAFDRRVTVVVGDVARPNLGLDAPAHRDLASGVDLVIHAAARTSLHGVYEELADVNVDGTRHVVELALATPERRLLYVSSYAVIGDRLFHPMTFTERDRDVGQGFEALGYARSKLEGERVVTSAGTEGLRWVVVRPGNVFGEGATGRYPLDRTGVPGLYYDLLRAVIALGAAPDTRQPFDITPVDYVSRAIAHVGLSCADAEATYHLMNPDRTSFRDVILGLRALGYDIALVPPEEFIRRAEEHAAGLRSTSLELLLFNPALLSGGDGATFSTEQSRQVLGAAGIECPRVQDLLPTYMAYCAARSYLPPPRHAPLVSAGASPSALVDPAAANAPAHAAPELR
jgi:thioester reductase-like protein